MSASPPPAAPNDRLEFPMRLFLLAALAALASYTAAAEEGMWTFDNPPTAAVQQKVRRRARFRLAQPRTRESTVRLETGCTGSFVSETAYS
jgi:hypothetical protein